MADEKFISIPFDIWESKYKPLEKKVYELERKLSEKKIQITLFDGTSWRSTDNRNLGYIDLSINVSDKLKMEFDYLNFEQTIHMAWYNLCEKFHYPTKDDLNCMSRDVADKLERMVRLRDSNYKNYNKIPKIIKWLFKIQ